MTIISEGPRSVTDAVAGLDIRSRAFIDGAHVDAVSGETFDCVSPITGEVVAQVAAGDWPTSTARSPARAPHSRPGPGRASRRRSASAFSRNSPG